MAKGDPFDQGLDPQGIRSPDFIPAAPGQKFPSQTKFDSGLFSNALKIFTAGIDATDKIIKQRISFEAADTLERLNRGEQVGGGQEVGSSQAITEDFARTDVPGTVFDARDIPKDVTRRIKEIQSNRERQTRGHLSPAAGAKNQELRARELMTRHGLGYAAHIRRELQMPVFGVRDLRIAAAKTAASTDAKLRKEFRSFKNQKANQIAIQNVLPRFQRMSEEEQYLNRAKMFPLVAEFHAKRELVAADKAKLDLSEARGEVAGEEVANILRAEDLAGFTGNINQMAQGPTEKDVRDLITKSAADGVFSPEEREAIAKEQDNALLAHDEFWSTRSLTKVEGSGLTYLETMGSAKFTKMQKESKERLLKTFELLNDENFGPLKIAERFIAASRLTDDTTLEGASSILRAGAAAKRMGVDRLFNDMLDQNALVKVAVGDDILRAFNIDKDNPQGSPLSKGGNAEIDNAMTIQEKGKKQKIIFDMSASIVNNNDPTIPQESRVAAAYSILDPKWASTLVPGTERSAFRAQLGTVADPEFLKNIASIASEAKDPRLPDKAIETIRSGVYFLVGPDVNDIQRLNPEGLSVSLDDKGMMTITRIDDTGFRGTLTTEGNPVLMHTENRIESRWNEGMAALTNSYKNLYGFSDSVATQRAMRDMAQLGDVAQQYEGRIEETPLEGYTKLFNSIAPIVAKTNPLGAPLAAGQGIWDSIKGTLVPEALVEEGGSANPGIDVGQGALRREEALPPQDFLEGSDLDEQGRLEGERTTVLPPGTDFTTLPTRDLLQLLQQGDIPPEEFDSIKGEALKRLRKLEGGEGASPF